MPLSAGDRLGPYEIVAPIGAGGMGEVYRAKDTKLGREVAIKVLPAAFAQHPERLARFEREAKVLASLNHPNIAQIYGLEESGAGRALVMELVQGETLSETVTGPVPVDTALKYAAQIASALDAAHEKGIIHRDLKPANIMLTPDGVIKVLDFGLAAVTQPSGERSGDPNNSPTLTMGSTQAGTIMGTAAYMSPEQASGKPVDRRADIWSFGVVLWEMLTGKRLFEGETISHILAAVLTQNQDLQQVPLKARHLLESCLQKDVRKRLQAMGDWRLLLEETPRETVPATRSRLPWVVAAALALIAATSVAFALWNRPGAVQKTEARLTIPLPPGQEITTYPAITRDGRTIAYVTQQGTEDSQLYLRDLNSFESRAVAGSSGAKQPFFSPDGKWIAFFAQGQLQKAEVAGGAPIRLAEAVYPKGGTWNEDNTIIYVSSLGSGLLRIPASGGTPESLTKPDGAVKGYAHVFPQALPGGRSVLFTIWGQGQGGMVLALDSRHEDWVRVLPATSFASAIFGSTGGSAGRLLLVDQSAGVRAGSFDAAHPTLTSADTSVLNDVNWDVETEPKPWLAVANNGTAVYAPGNPARTSLVWVDREGKIEPVAKDEDVYREASLSPDGTKAVVRHSLDLWIHDLQRGTRSPLTTASLLPLWSRDGTRIIFASNRGGDWDIYSQPADGSRPAEVLLKRPYDQLPLSISADGTLLYREVHPKTGSDLWTLSPDGKTTPLRVTQFNEWDGQFSPGPDGARRWVAYSSDESGRSEIYVLSYPGGANRIPVSNGGGILPRWSHDGKELFYATGDAVVAVGIRPDGSFGAPRKLFDRSNYLIGRYSSFDVSPDGKRFLMIRRDEGSVPRQLNVILNWTQ
jgi:serine/threonine protein kinase/Tol biopolymer transport system component